LYEIISFWFGLFWLVLVGFGWFCSLYTSYKKIEYFIWSISYIIHGLFVEF